MESTAAKSRDNHEAIQNVVEHLKQKRGELQREINKDEVEKAKLLGEMDRLKDKLSIIETNLKKKSEFRKDYDKAINQSEGNFVELMQKSEDFLASARREAMALSQAIGEPAEGEISRGMKCKSRVVPDVPRETEVKPNQQPAAVISFQSPETGNCVNCSNNYTCTTIAVPYRANGL